MKSIFFIILTLISVNCFSQDIHYLSVSPKYNYEEDFESLPYNNIAVFDFFLNEIESHQNKYCLISFAFDELGEYSVSAKTGWKYEYLEYSESFTISNIDSSYCTVTVLTNNLPKIYIGIAYCGAKREIRINDVNIWFEEKKY